MRFRTGDLTITLNGNAKGLRQRIQQDENLSITRRGLVIVPKRPTQEQTNCYGPIPVAYLSPQGLTLTNKKIPGYPSYHKTLEDYLKH